MSSKEIRSDAKLKNLPKEDLDELWLMRHPVDGKKPWKLAKVQTEIPLRYGVTVAMSSLSEFYAWLRQKRETEAAIKAAEQAKLQYLNANPDASPESLNAVAQMIFTNKAMQTGDADMWVKVAGVMERRKAREFNEKKFQAAIKSKLEAGLDALFEEIKGNEKAEAIFANLKGVLEES